MNVQNKKTYTCLLIVALFFVFTCKNPQPNARKAVAGKIDLQESSLLEGEVVKLDGDWEFYYNHFYSTSEILSSKKNLTYLKFPGFWNETKVEGKTIDGSGYATFRLVIHPPKNLNSFGLYIPHAFTTYRLYVNGTLVSENGVPGKSKAETKELWLPKAAFFSSDGAPIEILIHVANFISLNGGFRQSIEFGSSESILNTKQTRLSFDLFFIGCFFVISLYHLSLYLLRKTDLSLLYFSIYSFLGLLYQATSGEYSCVLLFPNIEWLFLIKIFLNSAFLSFPILLSLLRILFPDESKLFLHKTFQIIFLILVTIVFISYSSVLETTILIGEVIVLFASLYILFIFISAFLHKRESALGFLFGYLVFFIFAINDILFEKNIIQSEIYGPIGTLVLFFSQTFFLSKKFTRLYTTIEKQNVQLEKNAVLTERIYQSNIQSKRMELELLKKTIQPHFLMNSLSAIRYWIIEKPENSTEILDALAGELRIIQNVASKKLISIMDEYRLCKYHISVMKMRMEKSYRLSLRGFHGEEMIPPLLFHTLLENAFTHEDSSSAKLSFCILKKKSSMDEILSLHFCFIVHNHNRSKMREVKPGSGTGMEYIRLRMEESYPGKWKLEHGKSKFGYRVVIRVEEIKN